MPSLTVENYLKAILQVCVESDSDRATPGQITAAMNVSSGTVTSMLRTLSDSRLAQYKPYSGVTLTKQGRSLAVRIIRRHRLLELFLVRTLDLTWDQVHDEAERMEHAVSDELVDRIEQYLDFPRVDPHGDPIPTADGQLHGKETGVPLTDVEPGKTVKIIRVRNQTSEFLRYLSEQGAHLGTVVTVDKNSEEGDIVSLQLPDRQLTLGYSAAEMLDVEEISEA